MFLNKYLFLLATLIFLYFNQASWVAAQTGRHQISLGPSLTTSISYVGLGLSPGLSLKRNNWELIVGPRLALTDMYQAKSGPWGVASSLYYTLATSTNKRLKSLMAIDYQNAFYKPYCASGNCHPKRSFTQEWSLGYGLNFHLTPRLIIVNALNLGVYQESIYNEELQEYFRTNGLNVLVKVGLTYRFVHAE